MTDQKIFDKVWDHFILRKQPLSQVAPSIINIAACCYRGENGAKCAGGIFIPDDEYSSDMEGKTVQNIEFFQLNFHFQMDLLGDLQRSHDNAAHFSIPMDGALQIIAGKRGLVCVG